MLNARSEPLERSCLQFDYTQTCHDVVASGSSTEVKFGFLQVPSFFHFDDVSAAPE